MAATLLGLAGCAARPADGMRGLSIPGGQAHALRVLKLAPLDSVPADTAGRELRLWPGGFGPTRVLRVVERGDSIVAEWWAAVPRVTGGSKGEREEYQRALRNGFTCMAERPGAEGTACLRARREGEAARVILQRIDSLLAAVPRLPDPPPGTFQVDGMSLLREELAPSGLSSFRFGNRYFQPGSAARELLGVVQAPEP